jgi:hypothetical protein
MSKVGSVGTLACAMVFALGMLLMTSSSYAHRGGHGGGHSAHRIGHHGVGVHHRVNRGVHRGVVNRGVVNRGVYRGVHRGVHRGVWRNGRYYNGWGGGGVVVNAGPYNSCNWVRAHYNSSGRFIPAHKVCRPF